MKGKLGRNPVDYTGRTYGRLTVVRFHEMRGRRKFWECLCECGGVSYCDGGNLKNGSTKSCGCLQKEMAAKRNRSHGESSIKGKTKEYSTWVDVKTRCYNQKEDSYKYYGGKGIKMCERWIDSYENFLADMGRAPSPQHSIERNDSNKDYAPENCRWATIIEQMNNTSRTRRVSFNGIIKPFSVWCRELNLNKDMVYQRIHRLKWSVEDAFTKPCSLQ